MNQLLLWLASVVCGYVVGSIPVAVLVARRAGFDPRVTGDRNAGFWNVKERVGWRRALPVFAGDFVKGAIAGVVGLTLVGSLPAGYAAVAAAMVGHAWPVFAAFHGGKSVLTFAGGMAVLTPVSFLVAVAVLVVVALVTQSFGSGARVAIVALPVAQLAFMPPIEVAWTGALMTFIGAKFMIDRAVAGGRVA